MKLTNMKLAKRLAIGFGAQTVLAVCLGTGALWGSACMQRAVKAASQQGQESATAGRAMDDMHNITQRLLRMALSQEPAAKERLKAEVEELRADYRREMDLLKRADGSEQGRQLLGKVEEAISAGKQTNLRVAELSLAGKNTEASAVLTGDGAQVSDNVQKSFNEYLAYRQAEADKTNREATSLAAQAEWVVFGSVAGSVAMAILFGVLITRSISVPLSGAVRLLETMSQGDLTHDPSAGSLARKDEVGDLARAVEVMTASLRRLLREVSGGVHTLASSATELSSVSTQANQGVKAMSAKATTVAAAAEEMSASSLSVSAGMEEAAQSLNTVATATEEMTSTIGEIASNSEKARAITSEATQEAERVSGSMRELTNAAEAIGKVTETITNISDQTKLLALNATIEAARAGAAARGLRWWRTRSRNWRGRRPRRPRTSRPRWAASSLPPPARSRTWGGFPRSSGRSAGS